MHFEDGIVIRAGRIVIIIAEAWHILLAYRMIVLPVTPTLPAALYTLIVVFFIVT